MFSAGCITARGACAGFILLVDYFVCNTVADMVLGAVDPHPVAMLPRILLSSAILFVTSSFLNRQQRYCCIHDAGCSKFSLPAIIVAVALCDACTLLIGY